MSTRIRQAGFAISLIREAHVYHKAARKRAAVQPSGLRVRHVAHHALSALSRLAETCALASCRVCDRCGGHGCAAAVVSWMWLLLVAYLLAVFGCALTMTRALKSCPVDCGERGAARRLRLQFPQSVLHENHSPCGRNIEEDMPIRKENKHTQTSLRWKHLTGQSRIADLSAEDRPRRRRWLLVWRH